jgi:serine/threonine kinase 38
MQLHDFALIRLLGDGTSGTVQLVREKSTGFLYALKSMPKHGEQSIERGAAERDSLLLFRGEDRIMQFYDSFHDNQNFYILTVSISPPALHTFFLI